MKNILLLYTLIIPFTTSFNGAIKQGIMGKIYVRKGNYMPSPGQAPSMGRPLSTTVAIYELTNREQANSANGTGFDHIQTRLVLKTKSNVNGEYAVALPAGTYSIFTEYNGSLYANNIDDKGNINAVIVKKDSVSVRDIIISAQAVY